MLSDPKRAPASGKEKVMDAYASCYSLIPTSCGPHTQEIQTSAVVNREDVKKKVANFATYSPSMNVTLLRNTDTARVD